MSTHLWCDRARYTVKQTQEEIEELVIDAADANEFFIWVDRIKGSGPSDRVMLKIDKISAAESL
jgi:hypothetical protein